mgnify:CR=1 FL=1
MEKFDMFYNNQNRLNNYEEDYNEPEQTFVSSNGKSTIDYNVKLNDNLYNIAKEYGTTVAELLKVNNLTSTMIYPNQVLLIPYQKDNGMYYKEYLTVQGDSLSSISNTFNIPTDVLMMYNDVLKLQLEPNQPIRVPIEEQQYVVQEGETVQSLIEKTGLSCRKIMNLNQDKWLKPGETIIIK